MRTQITDDSIKLWLSKHDTWGWANKRGACWAGSRLSSRRLFAEFDSNGLVDVTVDGRYGIADCSCCDVSTTEFNAITSDFLRDKLPKDHPLYHITVGQFDEKEVK